MTRKKSQVFRILLLILLAAVLLSPRFFWFLRKPLSGEAVILTLGGPLPEKEGKDPRAWPFLNTRYRRILRVNRPEDLPAGKENPRFFLAAAETLPEGGFPDEADAAYAADLIKGAAVRSGVSLFEAGMLGEKVHPLLASRLATFLDVRNTGWSVLYLPDSRALEGLSPMVKDRLPSLPDSSERLPLLVFSHTDGRTALLTAGRDFSGRAPLGRLEGRHSELYTWIPVFQPLPPAEPLGSVDLQLTGDGRRQLEDLGIPGEIPLAVRRTGPEGTAWLTVLDLPAEELRPGPHRTLFRRWYKSDVSLFRTADPEKVFWHLYLPLLTQAESSVSADPVREIQATAFGTRNSRIVIRREGEPETEFFIQGVNLGTALPGTWFTSFPEDEQTYLDWFEGMAGLGLNSLRVYTLLPPSFYRALACFNRSRPENPLYLIQEIWPEENPPEQDLLGEEYRRDFQAEIRMDIDALHGTAEIPYRNLRAWGRYDSDVSPWLLALLIGRELEPDEIRATDTLHPGWSYSGRYFSSDGGSPSESWLAWACDTAGVYEQENYGRAGLLGIVSWPTLDPLHHPSEWSDPELNGQAPYNDRAVVDISHISVDDDYRGGLIGAYHIYPNYPDFMNNQEEYASYTDREGSFRYGGYLAAFMEQHTRYPAIVAEYGLSTSLATAHVNPDGYDHGGLGETEQAEGIIRMNRAIRREGYSGAVIFEWMDEWAKKTWITEPFMIPYERHVLWHNRLDPEQNYGLLAMDAASSRKYRSGIVPGSPVRFSLRENEEGLTLRLENLPGETDEDTVLLLGLDTYARDRGSRELFPGGASTETGMEFLLELRPGEGETGDSRLLAAESYNSGLYRYASSRDTDQRFLPVRLLTNRGYRNASGKAVPPVYSEWGRLKSGPLENPGNSVEWADGAVTVRIPWGLLNMADPSGAAVLDDPGPFAAYPLPGELSTVTSDFLLIYARLIRKGKPDDSVFPLREETAEPVIRWSWTGWETPSWTPRPKASWKALETYFRSPGAP